MAAAAHRKNTHTAVYVAGTGERREPGGKGGMNFHGKWTPHLALLSSRKVTGTIISGRHLRPGRVRTGRCMTAVTRPKPVTNATAQ